MGDETKPAQDLDYGDDAPQAMTPEEAFPKINAMFREAMDAEKAVAQAEEELKKQKARLRGIVEDALPKLMEECGVKSFTTQDGIIINVREKIENSIPAPRRNEAWDWLTENGHGDVLKREVTVAFGVTEGDVADELAKRLGQELARSVFVERRAEPATVKSIITSRLEAGKTVPMDLFGVRRFKIAEFKVDKKK
jgi:hypothetical protein